MIKASHLKKSFKNKPAVNDISFKIDTGKVTGFLGPNGAGKSTTMRLMLGLDLGQGETTFDNKLLHDYPNPSRVAGVLLEAKAFHPTRSARNHLRIIAAAGGIPFSRVEEALALVGLENVAKKGPNKFSLGMSQRLGIAAAILGEPKYLLLDEPANGLDPEGIAWLREFLKDYAAKGNGVFVSSHLLNEMSQMADNVVVIGRGKLIADTSIKELINSKGTSRVVVRSNNQKLLKLLFDKNNFSYEANGSKIELNGTNTETVGKLAFDNKITILELTNIEASLEDAFLELTEGSDEYKAKMEKK